MISLSSIFKKANNQSEKQRDVLVMVEDQTLFAEKTTETDWGNNVSESQVDYTSSPPDAGNVIIEKPFSWAALTSGASIRAQHSAIEYNGKIYIFAGTNGGPLLNDMWEYDISGDSWTQLTSGATVRHGHSAIEYNGKIYIFGGFNGTLALKDVWEYDIAGDSWTQLTSGATIRYTHSAILHGDKMYIFAGYDGSSILNDLWVYDITGDSWASLTSGASIRAAFTAIEYNGKIYIFGGDNGSSLLNDVWEYDIDADSWNQLTSGASVRTSHTAILHDDKMYIFAGYGGGAPTQLNDVWEYGIASDSWAQKTSGASVRNSHSAIAYKGKMYIYGGYSGAAYLTDIWENHVGYQDDGNITTDNIDIGEVPTATGEWAIEDITPDDSDITYEAWYSTTGLFDVPITESQTGSDSSAIIASRGAFPEFAQDWQSFKYSVGDFGELQEIKGTFSKTFGGSHDIRAGLYDAREGTQIGVDVVVALTTSGSTPTELTFDFSGQSLDILGDTTYWIKFFTTVAVPLAGNLVHQIYNSNTSSYPDGQLDRKTSIWYNNIGDAKFEVTINAWGNYIGSIIDGQAITDLKRYWRVKASFTANTARDETPTLQSIKADYTTYRRFNKIPDLGYEPLVTSLSSLTSKVDFFKPASIGQTSVGIQMTDAISDWVYNDTLYNKIVQVKLGFKYDGFGEADYIHYFTGAIDDWSVNDRILNLTLKDMSKEWKLPVPSKWEIGDDVTWTNEHHTDVMLDIFQTHINVRDSGLLLDSFATVKAATSGYQVTRSITGKTEDAKKLVEELRVLLMAFFLPRGDGKIGIKQFDSTEAIVTTFTDDNTMRITWRANSKDLINRTSLYFDWNGDGDDEADFLEYDEGNNTTSRTKFKEIHPYTLKDKWTDVAEATQISGLETKILDQFDDMPARVTISCDAKDIAYEAGDMVGVTTLEAPGNNGAGITDEKYLLVSKDLDFLGDKIVFEGLKVAV